MRFSDHVVVVTGAAQNNGLGIARRFVSEGAAVAILDIKAEMAMQSAEDLKKMALEFSRCLATYRTRRRCTTPWIRRLRNSAGSTCS